MLATLLGLSLCASNGFGQSTPATASPVVADVLRLSQAKVEENIIIGFIHNSPGAHLTASEIIDLRAQGLSAGILVALMNAQPGSPAAALPPPARWQWLKLSRLQQRQHKQSWWLPLPRTRVIPWFLLPPSQSIMTSVLRIISIQLLHIMDDLSFGIGLGWGLGWGFAGCWGWGGWGWGGCGWGGYPYCGSWYGYGYHGNGYYGYGNGYHGNGNGYHGNGYQNGQAGGHPPGHPIPADTQVGMPGQAEDLRVVSLAEPDSLGDTVGLWPQQDIRGDQPPPGGVNLVRRQRDTPPREQQPEQAVRARQEQLRHGHAKRPGLSQQGPHPRGLQQGLASR